MRVGCWRRFVRRAGDGSKSLVRLHIGAACAAHALMACGSLTTPDSLSHVMVDGGAASGRGASSLPGSSQAPGGSALTEPPNGVPSYDSTTIGTMTDGGPPVGPPDPPDEDAEPQPPLATCPDDSTERPGSLPPDARAYPLGQSLGVDFTLAEDRGGFPAPYDACGTKGVYFMARGSGRVRFSAVTAETEAAPSCPRLGACWDGESFDLEDDWRPYEMWFVRLVRDAPSAEVPALNLARLTRLSFAQEAEDASGNFWFMLDEIHFLPSTADIRNVALDRNVVVLATSTGPGFSPANVIDRDEFSGAPGQAWTNASDAPEGRLPQSLEIDLLAPRRITGVAVIMTEGLAIKDFDIQTWDGENWIPLVAERGNTLGAVKHSPPEVEASKLRVLALAGPDVAPQLARIDEIQIIGRDLKLAPLVEVGFVGRVTPEPEVPGGDAGPAEEDAGPRRSSDPTAPCRENPIACVRP